MTQPKRKTGVGAIAAKLPDLQQLAIKQAIQNGGTFAPKASEHIAACSALETIIGRPSNRCLFFRWEDGRTFELTDLGRRVGAVLMGQS